MIKVPEEVGYKDFDRERFVPQAPSSNPRRGEFARDRARVLHSAAFRKLSAKTQVLSPSSGDFARTRLTHSLEVAQVGRELATTLSVDPDLVDMACLAHDLGHPPFGHNGEAALNHWNNDFGGFEGNAQTFRVLTRLEPKIYSEDGQLRGLNLTRASLDAATKYPWTRLRARDYIMNSDKFGVFEEDLEVFNWMRQDAPDGAKCVEAQIMDFADDVAYSVHDFEDAIVEGFIDPSLLHDASAQAELIRTIGEWEGGMLASVQLEEALSNLRGSNYWLTSYDGSARDQARLKNLSSDLIGSFVSRTTASILENAAKSSLTRYRAGVIIPSKVRSEIAVLKGLVAAVLMTAQDRQSYYEGQRELLHELADQLLATGPTYLDPLFADNWHQSESESNHRRAVIDQIASLTDPSAIALHSRIVAGRP